MDTNTTLRTIDWPTEEEKAARMTKTELRRAFIAAQRAQYHAEKHEVIWWRCISSVYRKELSRRSSPF